VFECAIEIDHAGDDNAKVGCSEVMREGQRGEDSAKVSLSEAQRQTLVMAM
jgi:hypothetical protein